MNEAPLSKAERAALTKLRDLIEEKDELHLFDKKEMAVIRDMIATYESFRSFGRLAHGVRQIVIWAGVMLGAYFMITEWIWKTLQKKLGGG